MRRFESIGLAVALGSLSLGSAARATAVYPTYTYTFGAGGSSTTNLTLSPGAAVDVPVYLQETFDPSGASLIDSEGGLSAATFQVVRTAGPVSPVDMQSMTAPGTYGAVDNSGNLSDLSVISNGVTSAYTQDGLGTSPTISTAPDQATVYYFPFTITSNITGTISGNTYTILLGTLHFQAGSDLGTTTFSATDDDPAVFDTVTVAGTFLDGGDPGDGNLVPSQIQNGTLNFTVENVIPEPASLVLAGAMLGFGAMRRRRSR